MSQFLCRHHHTNEVIKQVCDSSCEISEREKGESEVRLKVGVARLLSGDLRCWSVTGADNGLTV